MSLKTAQNGQLVSTMMIKSFKTSSPNGLLRNNEVTLIDILKSLTILVFNPLWDGGNKIKALIRIWQRWQETFWLFWHRDVLLSGSLVFLEELQFGNVVI